MAFGTLYTYTPNARILKIQAAAQINGLDINLAPDFQMGITNRSPEFLAKFPMGKVPCLETSHGALLFESDAIAQFVADSGPHREQLLGRDALERASIRQWICFADHEIMDPIIQLVMWRVGMAAFDVTVEERSMAALRRGLQCLERHLAVGQWVVTEGKLSLADLSLASALYWGFMQVIDAKMREEFPSVTRWYHRVIGQEEIRCVFSEATFISARQEHP
ncbi:hypothetical protein Asppvi_005643 [Aspergillus pseudoviridinutans]|uniref:Translation elongation factor eEF-1B gamma subunit n=1 Tax=Aspergillus pseudoviridinutans TaxID=1517512 RepID=A0A9P3BEA9_9EURO|nr:uncharacterized protein Asppvi_005643 [Aspergillus pseudoviridinutans]GIJ86748.1 hypothetical protein Asppvi_005643 [Aspergillus pseudoviridinutans]